MPPIIPLLFIILFVQVFLFSQGSGVVFSELYIKVKGSIYRDQWIELYNTSASNVDLRDYRIGDGLGGNVSMLSPWSETPGDSLPGLTNQITNSTVLSNLDFAVVLDHDFTNSEGLLSHLPPNTLILSVGESHLTGSSTISTEDFLYLWDAMGNLLDTYGSPEVIDALPLEEQREGESMEKIFYDEGDSEKNWSFSLSRTGSTPGNTNALSTLYRKQPASYLVINPFTATSEGVVGRILPLDVYALDDENYISFTFNDKLYLEYFDDLEISDAGYIKNKRTSGKLITFESIAGRGGRFSVSSIYPGTFTLKFSANGLESVSTRLRFNSFQSPYRGRVVISEVMYLTEDATDLGGNNRDQVDWIELYNTSDEYLFLQDWFLEKNESSVYVLTQMSIPAKSHLLLVANDTDFGALYSPGIHEDLARAINKMEVPFGTLNKSGGDVTLKDEFSNEVDILQYTDSYLKTVKRYGKKNSTGQYITEREFISLERKNPFDPSLEAFNWGHSSYTLGDVFFKKTSLGVTNDYQVPILATPGFANSRTFSTEKKLLVNIARQVYIVDKKSPQNFFFALSVNKSSLIEIKIYSRSGSYMGSLSSEVLGSVNKDIKVPFDGVLNGRSLPPGLYFVGVRAVGTDTGEESTDNMYFVIR